MITIENLNYNYSNGSKVLRNINLNIKDGEFVAVVGQNGAGKTTLLKHFNGLLKPLSGSIHINGIDASKTKTSRLARHIGFLFQNPDHQIFNKTVYDEIAYGLKNIGIKRSEMEQLVIEAAARVGLSEFLKANPFSLSKGQRQRVALASVLAMDTDVLVLDEPTTGQDYQESIEIMEMVKKLNETGKTIIFVTHDMELVARYAKRVVILNSGSILEDGPTDTVLQKSDSLAASNLESPQMFLLSKKFHKYGLFKDAFSVEDMFEEIITYLDGEKNARIG